MNNSLTVVELVIELHKQGLSYVSIAKSLNLHIDEVVEIINEYK